jgi:hypothetical protein
LYVVETNFCTTMPRVVVDVSPEALVWLESQRGHWKPRTAVLRELIDEAMRRDGKMVNAEPIKSA